MAIHIGGMTLMWRDTQVKGDTGGRTNVVRNTGAMIHRWWDTQVVGQSGG